MNVPRLFVLTDRHASASAGRGLDETVRRAVEAGAPAVVLREKDLPSAARRRLAADLAGIVARTRTRLLVAWTPEWSGGIRHDGVHLAAADPRPPSFAGLVGRSCHDRAEVATARREGLDYVTVSPVAGTASKPGYGPALGVSGVAELVAEAGPLPVVALGGVAPADAATLLGAGVHGLAVMGAVMRADDPARAVSAFLEHTLEATP